MESKQYLVVVMDMALLKATANSKEELKDIIRVVAGGAEVGTKIYELDSLTPEGVKELVVKYAFMSAKELKECIERIIEAVIMGTDAEEMKDIVDKMTWGDLQTLLGNRTKTTLVKKRVERPEEGKVLDVDENGQKITEYPDGIVITLPETLAKLFGAEEINIGRR